MLREDFIADIRGILELLIIQPPKRNDGYDRDDLWFMVFFGLGGGELPHQTRRLPSFCHVALIADH